MKDKTHRIGFIRHSKAAAAERNQNDFDRVLSAEGIGLAKNLQVPITYDIIISSSAPRVLETMTYVTGKKPEKVIIMQELYDVNTAENIEEMYEAHGDYALPYLGDERAADLHERLKLAAKKVAEIVDNNGSKNILIFGHAVLLNYLAYYMFGNEAALNVVVQPATGFVITGPKSVEVFV